MRSRLANCGLGLALNLFFRSDYSAQRLRKNFDLLTGKSAGAIRRKYPGVVIERGAIQGIPVENISFAGESEKTILYLHGGGYVMGSIHSYRLNAVRIALSCQATVVLPEYRLAPENTYPAALDDAIAVYASLIARVRPEKFVVGGDSAGGGLALATVLRAKGEQQPLPSAVFCFSPWTDLTVSLPSWTDNRKTEVWLNRDHSAEWARQYAGSSALNTPFISPLFGNYTNFPRTLLFAGQDEALLDDSKVLADNIRAAGASVELDIGQKMQHVWPLVLPFLPESQRAMRVLGKFVRG